MTDDVQVSAKEAVKAVRGSMTNTEIMSRFKLTSLGFADLLKQLLRNRLISEEDLTRRGISFKVQKKQSEEEPKSDPLVPPPSPEDTEFLDTAALTDLLSFKPDTDIRSRISTQPTEIEPLDETPEPSEKGTTFGFSGLMKKG